MTDLLQFCLAVLTLLAAPGPTNTVMAIAGAGPARSPLPLLAAGLAGYLAIIALARFVLVPLIDLYPPLEPVIKLAVIGYLLYAAFRLWRGSISLDSDVALVGPGTVFVTTFLNPKGLIFAVSVFPRAHEQLWLFFLLFAAFVGLCGFLWFALGQAVARLSGKRATLLPRVASVALLTFAALLAVSLSR